MARSRNRALKLYVNGRRAEQLDGLTDLAGRVLSSYDRAVQRAVVGLKRRALPAARRAVRSNYNVTSRALANRFRVEVGHDGRGKDRSEFLGIWASTRSVPLIEFGGRWTGPARKNGRFTTAASASIEKGGRKTYAHAFIATVKGRRAIRVRSRLSTGRRAARGPLRMLYGPSPFEMLSGIDHAPSLKTQRTVLAELTEFYMGELRRQFRLQGS